MKVDFKNCKFGCFEPHYEIEYNGNKYRAIDVSLVNNDGVKETHTIAEFNLECAMSSDVDGYTIDINNDLDDSISYYADFNDDVFYILEQITGEKIN